MTPLRNLMIFPSDGRIGRMPGDAGLSGAATQRCSAMPWAHSWKRFLHPPIERLWRARREAPAKLADWIDQFGTSGCVGCGRCIAWCPVVIDISEES